MYYPEGVFPAMLMPFDQEGLVNESELRKYVDFLIEGGLHGLFPISSVGESIHMSMPEKRRAMEIVTDQAAGRVPVVPGGGQSQPQGVGQAGQIRPEPGLSRSGGRAALLLQGIQRGDGKVFRIHRGRGGYRGGLVQHPAVHAAH